jgi:DNA-binding response OmpR family regulator
VTHAPPLSGVRLLVVDDEFLVAVHLEMLLDDFGSEVAGVASTVERALELVRTERLDGVLLDCNLNGESSAPVATELKSRSTPFVLVTGYGGLDLDIAFNGAPRLSKPFVAHTFEATLAAVFRPATRLRSPGAD